MTLNKNQSYFVLTKICLLLLFVVPLLSTSHNSSQIVNLYAELLQFIFVLLLLRQTTDEVITLFNEAPLFKYIIFSILFLYVGWILEGLNIFSIYRTLHFVVYLLFFATVARWFKTYGKSAFIYIAKVKIAIMILMFLFMLFYLTCILPPLNYLESNFFNYPPVYRHLRHMNYDVAIALAFAIYLYCRDSSVKKYLYLLFIYACGFFTVWSAARGQMVSLLAFLSVLIYLRLARKTLIKITTAMLSFTIGGASVFLTTYTDYIDERNTLNSTENIANKLSSNRLNLWKTAIEKLNEDHAWLFGLGPDAWVRVELFPEFSQAHNFVLQWLFEFGLPVTVLLLVIMFRSVIFSLKLRNSSNDLTIEKMIAALMLSTFAYALVDGQFYHTIPFTMILIMAAYLFSQASSVRKTP